MHVFAACLGAAILSFAPAKTHAQMGFGPRGGSREMENIVPRFDADKDGRLDDAERKSAREYIRSQGFNRGAGRSSGSLNAPQASARSTLESDLQLSATSAPATRKNLYDESTLRTLYIRFSGSDWYEELSDFYGTGVEVPADLVLDGKVYRSVGVRFRGNSSYGMTGSSPKKPIGVSVDYEDDAQRLYGYRTLNLLNANADPSFMREALFSRISRQYIPTPRRTSSGSSSMEKAGASTSTRNSSTRTSLTNGSTQPRGSAGRCLPGAARAARWPISVRTPRAIGALTSC